MKNKIKIGVYYTIHKRGVLMLAIISCNGLGTYRIEYISVPSGNMVTLYLKQKFTLGTIKKSQLKYLGKL